MRLYWNGRWCSYVGGEIACLLLPGFWANCLIIFIFRIIDFTMLPDIQVTAKTSAEKELMSRCLQMARMGCWEYVAGRTRLTCTEGLFFLLEKEVPDELSIPVTEAMDFVHPDDKGRLELMRASIVSGQVLECRFRIITGSGTVRWISGWCEGKFTDEGLLYSVTGVCQDITELVSGQDALERRRAAMDNAERLAGTGTYQLNLATGEKFYSDNIFRIYGYEPGSIPAEESYFFSLTHPDDAAPLMETYRKLVENPGRMETSFRIIRKDGTLRYLQTRSNITTNSLGQMLIEGTTVDVTEHRLLEEELERQNELLQQAEATAKLGSWKYNFGTKQVSYSENLFRLFGYEQPQDYNDTSRIFTHLLDEDREKVLDAYRKTIADGLARSIEFRLLHPDGTMRYFTSVAKKTVNRRNEKIIVGMVQDITDTHLMRLKLEQQQRLTHKLLDSSVNAISVYDSDQKIVLWNKKLEQQYGVSREEAIGKRFAEIMPGHDMSWFDDYLKEALAGKEVQFHRQSLKDGRDYLTHMVPIDDNGAGQRLVFVLSSDVTLLKEQEREIQLQRDFAEELTDRSMDCIFVFDRELKLVKWNAKCEELYGKKKEEVLGMTLDQIFPDADMSVPVSRLRLALEGEMVRYSMEPSRVLDRYYESAVIPIRDSESKVSHILCVLHDVTEVAGMTKRVREVNRLLEQRNKELADRTLFLETLLDSTVDSVVAFDTEQRIIAFNRTSERKYGRLRDEVIGRKVLDAFPALKDTESMKELDAALSGQFVHVPERANTFGEGYHEKFLIPLVMNGTVTGALGIVRDITEMRLAVEELQERTHFNQTLIDSIVDVITAVDNDLRFTMWNRTAEKKYKINREDVLGKKVTDVFPALADTPQMEELIQALEKGQSRTMLEVPYHQGHGFCDIFYIPLRNAAGKVTGLLAVVHDITAIKNSSLQLEELNGQLANKNHELNRINSELASFSYVASHDLQEPLRKIQAFTSLILAKDSNNISESGQDYFRRIQASAGRMQQMIDGLLLFSRTNTAPKHFERRNLNELLQDVSLHLNDEIRKKGAIIVADELPEVMVISHQFEQLMEHVLTNALRFQPQGNIPEIRISAMKVSGKDIVGEVAQRNRTYQRITVSDNGIGFSPEEAEKIFQMFYRLHGKSEYPGTGIGLSICRRIAQNHNGFITAESEGTGGARFHIYLPVPG